MTKISKLPGKIKRGGLCPGDVVIEREIGYCTFKVVIENPNKYRTTTTILNIKNRDIEKAGTVLTGTTFKLPGKMNKKAQDTTLKYDVYMAITYEKHLDIIRKASMDHTEWSPDISIESNKATIIFTG